MRLLCYDIPNTLNYGSMMMAESYMYHVAKSFPEMSFEFIVLSTREQAVQTKERFEAALKGVCKIEVVSEDDILGPTGHKVKKIKNLVNGKKLIALARDAKIDGVVVFGGDDFSDTASNKWIIKEFCQFHHLLKNKLPVIFIGQTMGPFRYKSLEKLYIPFLKRKGIHIYCRDPRSFRYLSEKGLQNITLAADLAFLPLCREGEESGLSHPMQYDNYLTVVPSGLIYRYGLEQDLEAYVNFLATMTINLMDRCEIEQVVLLPHVLAPPEVDDRPIGSMLRQKLTDNLSPERVLLIAEELLPYQARSILGRSRLVFTGRMHAAISALEQGVVPLSLAYSEKYHGIIGDYFGLSELVIDVRRKRWDELLSECEAAARLVRKYGEDLHKRITRRTREMVDLALMSVKDSVNRLVIGR